MKDFIAWTVVTVSIIAAVIFGVRALNSYDTTETLKINNERCGTVAADAGANEWKVNYEGECTYINRDGDLQQVEIN
ncbi:hypothetical protein [Caudoviricetes sp.]|nr:hypothetical protein [Caudoviricetes sp.]